MNLPTHATDDALEAALDAAGTDDAGADDVGMNGAASDEAEAAGDAASDEAEATGDAAESGELELAAAESGSLDPVSSEPVEEGFDPVEEGEEAVAGNAADAEEAAFAEPTRRARRAPRDLDAGLLRAAGSTEDILLESAPAPSTDPGFDMDDLTAPSRPLTEPGITGEAEPTEPDGPSPLGLLELGPALEAALADAEALADVRHSAIDASAQPRPAPTSQADARILEATRERLHEVREEVLALKRKLAAAESRAAAAERDLETTRADLKATRQRFVRSSERQEAELKRHERQHRELPERLLRKHADALFPALDALEAVVRQVVDGEDSVPEAISTAVSMVQSEFERSLGGLEITPFDALGQAFDPVVHAAVSERAPATDERPGQVVGQVGRGFLLRGRLMRPAQVVVTVGGADAEVPVGEGEEATEVDHETLGDSPAAPSS